MHIGETLRAAREKRGLTRQDVYKATRIGVAYLQALEDEDWQALPSRAHVRGFLRTYADFLHLDAEALLAEWSGEPLPAEPPPVDEAPASRPAAAERADEKQPAEEASAPPPPDDEIADEHAPYRQIFAEIGEILRKRRELLGLTQEEISQHTHIARPYIDALEKGHLERLPTPVQMRGMLQQYASFIELDQEALLLRFAEGLQAWRAARFEKTAAARTSSGWHVPRFLRRWLAPDLFFTLLALTLFSGLFIWWLSALSQTAQAPATATVPSISDVLLSAPGGTPSPTPSPPAATDEVIAAPLPTENIQATPTLSLNADEGGKIQVTIGVSRRVWLRVLADGAEVLRQRAAPGAAYQFDAQERLEIQASDAAALQIYYNGRDLGLLGAPGTLLTLIFSADAVLTPTLTITPTPTASATPTITPSPTRTPIPTRTPRP